MDKFNYYIAGFFDGEGSMDINGRIGICNTDLYLLEKISAHLSKIGIENKISSRGKIKSWHKPAYDIRICGRANIDSFYTYIPFNHNEKRRMMLSYIVRTKGVITKAELKKIKADHKRGMTIRALGKKYNHPHSSIHRYIRKEIIPNIEL